MAGSMTVDFKQIFDGSPVAISIIRGDREERIYFNNAFERMYRGAATGGLLSISDSWVNPEERVPIANKMKQQEFVGPVVVQRRRADGSTFWCIMTYQKVENYENGPAFISWTHDIDDRVKAEQEAWEVSREQAEFTYALSHDLRSPTNTLSMLLDELASCYITGLDRDAADLVHLAQSTVKRMGKTIEDTFEYSQSIDRPIAEEEVDLGALIDETLIDLHIEAAVSDLQIEVRRLPAVLGDIFQLRALFRNLISNAAKFRKQDEPLRIVIEAPRSQCETSAEIHVADNGIGIAPEYHERIFGLFQRLHTRDTYPGTGLGLSICRRIASNHGGRISVVSDVGEGARFKVFLRKFAK